MKVETGPRATFTTSYTTGTCLAFGILRKISSGREFAQECSRGTNCCTVPPACVTRSGAFKRSSRADHTETGACCIKCLLTTCGWHLFFFFVTSAHKTSVWSQKAHQVSRSWVRARHEQRPRLRRRLAAAALSTPSGSPSPVSYLQSLRRGLPHVSRIEGSPCSLRLLCPQPAPHLFALRPPTSWTARRWRMCCSAWL